MLKKEIFEARYSTKTRKKMSITFNYIITNKLTFPEYTQWTF